MKGTLIVIGIVVGLAALIGGIWAFRYFTAPIEGQIEFREDTLGSGDFLRVAYDGFFNSCAEIQGLEDRVRNGENLLSQLVPGSEQHTRTLTNISGAQSLRDFAVRRYNVDVQKDWTIGQVRDTGLPYEISIQGVTACR